MGALLHIRHLPHVRRAHHHHAVPVQLLDLLLIAQQGGQQLPALGLGEEPPAAGLGAALLRLSPWPVARGMAHVYVGCLRNTPLLLQLFFVYFLFAPAIGVGPFGAAVLALGLFEGAYMAELFRAGLQSVPRAQWEAGISLGLGVWNTLRLVILPQAVRRMLPPLTSQLVSLIKDTSLVSAIAVADLTMQAQVLIADTFLAFEIWLIVAALYLALTLCVALPARWMERRYAWR